MRVEQIQIALQLATRQVLQFALKVAVDVVGVIFVLHERAVDEDLRYADTPELIYKDREVFDKLASPTYIPIHMFRDILGPRNEQ